MADLHRDRVRAGDGPFAKQTSKVGLFREVGAPLVRQKTLSGSAVTIEWIERRGTGAVDWRYRQDRDALFYFEQGIVACRGELDGRGISRSLNGTSKLAFIEAGSTVETEVEVPGRCIYWVAFIDKDRLLGAEESLAQRRLESRIGIQSSAMASTMNSLRPELVRNDDLSTLYLESWATQALVILHRALDGTAPRGLDARIGKSALSKVIDFMEANVGADLTLQDIARLVDLSPRQMRRAFVAATGAGPSEMFTNIRLERAARDLRQSGRSVTEISLDCGFSQPQHLATAFRRKFGLTPTEFRRSSLS
ncbi:helix-turn-helix domain-containing protein [Afipia sp. GAS231]|uniref:helix-turn-helix domain-containing protein n=1 Tax=Afipia sp. GAS231 TaxID=1882747 RepID=UPI000879CB4D|nr:helix-turn-helix domain-containing protein [Afipia sp. GAS231]SDN28060.1 Helix-turn-helix domain-containing protein [Afipia sp. GAS231]